MKVCPFYNARGRGRESSFSSWLISIKHTRELPDVGKTKRFAGKPDIFCFIYLLFNNLNNVSIKV